MMRIYVAGPMTGLPGYNLPAFAAAALELRALGYDAVDPGRRGADPAKEWADYLRDALRDVLSCDAIALLDGWEKSRGAQLEVHVADSLGMPIEPLSAWLSEAAKPDEVAG